MTDVFLIIAVIIFTILALLVGVYYVYMFEHPEDKGKAWFYKVVVGLSLGISAMNVLILPIDAINRTTGNTLNVEVMCWVFTIASLILAFVIIPFSIMFYEGSDDEDVKHPLLRAILCVIPFLLFILILFLILWFAVGRCEVPIDIYNSNASGIPPDQGLTCPSGDECEGKSSHWNITPSAIVYCVSLIGFVGYLLLIILGGCGFITLPFNLIQSFVNRPKPISLEIYTKATQSVNRWAEELITEGQKLNRKVLKHGRNHQKVRQRLAKYEFQVDALEKAYGQVQISYKLRGGNPVGYWVKLILGICGIIITIVWILHIILFYLAHVTPFLNTFFDKINDGFPYAAVVFFAFFVFYLYWCVLDGTTTVGINMLIIRLHPMEKHNTPMSSMLFNTGVMLFASFGCCLFCTMMFSVYQRLTALDMIYGTQMQYLAGLKYVWQYAIYVMFACILAALIWKCVTLKKKDNKIDNLKELFEAYDTAGINAKENAKKEKKAVLNEDIVP